MSLQQFDNLDSALSWHNYNYEILSPFIVINQTLYLKQINDTQIIYLPVTISLTKLNLIEINGYRLPFNFLQ